MNILMDMTQKRDVLPWYTYAGVFAGQTEQVFILSQVFIEYEYFHCWLHE